MSSGNGVSSVAVTTVRVMMSATCGVLGDSDRDGLCVVDLDARSTVNAGSLVVAFAISSS